jgi:hypothetical protein
VLRLRYTEYTHSIILHEPQANAKPKSHLTPRLTRTGVEPCVEAVLNLKPDISHLQAAPKHTRTSRVSPYMHQDPIWFTTCTNIGFLPPRLRCRKADNAPKCSGAESSNANVSFPEHFEGKRQSGEMYQKDCLPLLSTFCKFQRLKVKGSRVMLVCLHQHQINTVAHENGSTSQRVQAVHTQRFNSFVAASSCICVWLLKCTWWI